MRKKLLIYTLVESGTQKKAINNNFVIVSGRGTNQKDNPSLLNRAKRKTITRKMILSLIDVAKEKGEPERQQMYWNAYHCQAKIISS